MHQQKPKHVLFGFSEKATKFEKNLRRTFDKSIMFCARNSVLVKKLTKNFQNKCDHLIIQTLMYTKKFIKPVFDNLAFDMICNIICIIYINERSFIVNNDAWPSICQCH